jgi:hypothetical protein
MTLPASPQNEAPRPTSPAANITPPGQRLAERVDQALRATGYPQLRYVEILVRDGVVTLRGHVPSFYLKLIAQESTGTVPGIQDLANELEVVKPPGRGRPCVREPTPSNCLGKRQQIVSPRPSGERGWG